MTAEVETDETASDITNELLKLGLIHQVKNRLIDFLLDWWNLIFRVIINVWNNRLIKHFIQQQTPRIIFHRQSLLQQPFWSLLKRCKIKQTATLHRRRITEFFSTPILLHNGLIILHSQLCSCLVETVLFSPPRNSVSKSKEKRISTLFSSVENAKRLFSCPIFPWSFYIIYSF